MRGWKRLTVPFPPEKPVHIFPARPHQPSTTPTPHIPAPPPCPPRPRTAPHRPASPHPHMPSHHPAHPPSPLPRCHHARRPLPEDARNPHPVAELAGYSRQREVQDGWGEGKVRPGRPGAGARARAVAEPAGYSRQKPQAAPPHRDPWRNQRASSATDIARGRRQRRPLHPPCCSAGSRPAPSSSSQRRPARALPINQQPPRPTGHRSSQPAAAPPVLPNPETHRPTTLRQHLGAASNPAPRRVFCTDF